PPGAVLLEAAVLPASARQPAGHEAEMADLAGRAESAAQQATAGDDGPADARADRQEGHVAHPAPGAEAELGPACRVRVVVDGDVQSGEPREQALADRLAAPVDVGRVVHARLLGVDEPRSRDAR